MEKMIAVINNNLRSIINGLVEHREDTENTLVVIKNEMDEKIGIAGQYKKEVEEARSIISSVEKEIADLENDLKDLTVKFGAKDFKEILAVGNREINTKIIEKRAQISEQTERIMAITQKAHQLKHDLVILKEKKLTTEDNLEKSRILEKFYTKRLNEIITFAENSPQELATASEDVSTDELSISTDELNQIDYKQVIDAKVFEEIDEISTNDDAIDEDLIKEVLDLPNDNSLLDEEDQELLAREEEEKKEEALSMTQQLDDIIVAANNLLEQGKQSSLMTPEEAAIKEEQEITSKDIIIAPETDLMVQKDIETDLVVAENKTTVPTVVPEAKKEDTIDLDEEEDLFIDITVPDYLKDVPLVDKTIQTLESVKTPEEVTPAVEPTDVIPHENDFSLNEQVIEEQTSIERQKDFYTDLKECNLEPDSFKEEDLITLQNTFNKENTQQFIEVLLKHNIPVSSIYENVSVLINVTPQNMAQILDLLERTGATNTAITYVYPCLDKVNINKLEEAVDTTDKADLTDVLYEALSYTGESDIIEKLNLNGEEESTLRRAATEDIFKKFNLFPEIVMANYQTLAGYHIDNLNECITRFPRRFVMNPDRFQAILDKYDTEDLVRCINKNAAVIERL